MSKELDKEFEINKETYKELLPADNFTLLDLGSGSQQRTMYFNFSYCYAVDVSPNYANETNARPHTQFILKDVIEFLTEDKRMWDVVVAFEVVEHLKFHRALIFIKLMKQHAKKLVMIITPDGFAYNFQNPNLINNPYEHRCGFIQEQCEFLDFTVIRKVDARIDMKARHDKEQVPYPPTWDRLLAYWRPNESV